MPRLRDFKQQTPEEIARAAVIHVDDVRFARAAWITDAPRDASRLLDARRSELASDQPDPPLIRPPDDAA